MRQLARSGLFAVLAVALATSTQAQAPPAGRATSPAAKAPTKPAAKAAPTPTPAAVPDEVVAKKRKQVLATVNGDAITRGELIDWLNSYPIPPEYSKQEVYDLALDQLINTKLLLQFLNKQNVRVPEEEVKARLALEEKNLAAQGTNLATMLAKTGLSMPDIRQKITEVLKWADYAKAQGTDAALQRYIDEHKDARDFLSGAQVRASHILVRVEPDAPAAEKEKARQKLAAIKKDIDSGKITFAEAANKYSEDQANVQTKAGGDLGFFPRRGHFIESFASAAFKLKKGEISDPVETEYGYHLIQVTDRIEGKPIDLKQQREAVFNIFAGDLQQKIITDARKTAKIDKKKMPDDLFQAPPDEAAPAAAPGNAAPKTKAAPGR